jgi:hypothetical protein
MRKSLGQTAGVDEHQGRAALLHEEGDSIEDLVPVLARRHSLQALLDRHLNREVQIALVS